MQQNGSRCYRLVDGILICSPCGSKVVKNGKNSTGNQRYCCKRCGYSRVLMTKYKAYHLGIDTKIVKLTKEGCGIRSTSRILEISPVTVIRKICKIANQLVRPYPVYLGKSYQR